MASSPLEKDMKHASSTADLSELIGAIYQAPLDELPWQGLTEVLRGAMGAKDVFLILRRPSETDLGVMFSTNASLPTPAPYFAQRLYTLDPFVNLPPNNPVLLSEVVEDSILQQSEFFNLILKPFDIFHLLGIDIHEKGGLRANLRLTRGQKQQPYGAAEKELATLLVPHLCRALLTYSRISGLETERLVYAGAMTQLAVATLLLDAQRRIVHTNPLADLLLGCDSSIRSVNGRLQLQDAQDNQRLRQLMEEAIEAQRLGSTDLARAMLVAGGAADSQMSLVVRPLPLADSPGGDEPPVIAVFLTDPSQQIDASADLLSQLFGLTPTEARLSVLLANGFTVDTASAELGMSPYTARAHLRSIFSKTGVSRQTQLVRLVLKSVASLG